MIAPDNYAHDNVWRLTQEQLMKEVELYLKHGWEVDGDSYYKDGFYTNNFEKTRIYCQKLKKKRKRGGITF